MTESSDTSDTPAKPQDYASLCAELAALADDFTHVITKLWPRLEDHKYRWELHSYGLGEGYDKRVVSDIIAMLIEALKGIGVADSISLRRTSTPRATIPPARAPPDQTPPHLEVSDCPIGSVKGVFDVNMLMASPPLTHPIVSAGSPGMRERWEFRCFRIAS